MGCRFTVCVDIGLLKRVIFILNFICVIRVISLNGPAQNEFKQQFLAELVHLCSHENLLIIGGDLIFFEVLKKRIILTLMIDR